jgi:protoporphyrinogen oxidase
MSLSIANSMPGRPDLLVVGGGIAGLTAAFRLHQAGFRPLVLEKDGPELLGGRMASIEHHGIYVDRGAILLGSRWRAMRKLISDLSVADQLEAASDLMGFVDDRGAIRVHGSRPLSLARSPLLRGVPPRDVARLVLDVARLGRSLSRYDIRGLAVEDGRSVVEYARQRGFSPTTLERLLEPLCVSQCLGDTETSSSLMPQIFAYDLALSRGFVTSRQGTGFLPRALAARIPVSYHTEVVSIDKREGGVDLVWQTNGVEFQATVPACVIAVPPRSLARIYVNLSHDERMFWASVRHGRSVHAAFRLQSRPKEPAALLNFSRSVSPDLAALTLPHNMAPCRVPAGHGLVVAYMRGSWSSDRTNWETTDSHLRDTIVARLRALNILPEVERDALSSLVIRTDPCLMAWQPGDYRLAARFSRAERPPDGVEFASGDYIGYCSTNTSLLCGERAARRVAAYLRRHLGTRDGGFTDGFNRVSDGTGGAELIDS